VRRCHPCAGGGVMTPLVSKMVAKVPDADMFTWFDASNLQRGHSVNLDVVNDTPLPFDQCAIVGKDGDAEWIILLKQVRNTVAYIGDTLYAGTRIKHPSFTYQRTPDGLTLHQLADEPTPNDVDEVRGLVATVGAWLAALSPGHSAYVPTPRPALINSKRAAKGKRPILFDWHTVTIGPSTMMADHKGGTHASPRMHDRRGHFRRHQSGRQIWVKPCKVGSASNGCVWKDYKVTK